MNCLGIDLMTRARYFLVKYTVDFIVHQQRYPKFYKDLAKVLSE
jgi:hypothetical protein